MDPLRLEAQTRSLCISNCAGAAVHDMARDAGTGQLRILAAGLNYHQNTGSSAGMLYAWDVDIDAVG